MTNTNTEVSIAEMKGPLGEAMDQFSGKNGRARFDQFKLWLKSVFLKRLFTFGLNPMGDAGSFDEAKRVFNAYLDPNFREWGIVFNGVAPETEVACDDLITNGTFADFLGNTAEELEKRRMKGSQFLGLCDIYRDKLRDQGYANFFILTKGDEPVAKDLSNVFVACVVFDGPRRLSASLSEFSYGYVWRGDYGRRVFCPQL